ncbi:MAG: glycosyltransferase family 4 protein [Acidimicrobiales bacterium]
MADRAGAVAFVTPRYGPDVVGGSEAVMREAAHGLAARGWEVEVLTTPARDHYTWADAYPPGTAEVDGVTVRRFELVREEGRYPGQADRGDLERRIAEGVPLDEGQEQAWVNGLFRVPDLYHHLVAEQRRYRAIVLSPYLFWTTLVGATVAPERTIVMPCLHDEGYARLRVVSRTLSRVARAWYLSAPERDLARDLGLAPTAGDLTGAGVPLPATYQPEAFRSRHGLQRPFVLYAGRREEGKGWPVLLAAFTDAVARGADLDLVTMGVGAVDAPPSVAERVHDLGFLPDEEAADAFAAAAVYVQPSRNESFSRTVMEAWMAGTPVLANAESAVVAWHCERSGAGVTWTGIDELSAAIEAVAVSPDAFEALAAPGRDYVLEHYTWPTVLDNMERSLEEMPWPAG